MQALYKQQQVAVMRLVELLPIDPNLYTESSHGDGRSYC